MKSHLVRTAQVVIMLVSFSIISMSCQREDPSETLTNGMRAFNNKNYEEALVLFSKAIEMYPYFAEPYCLRARTHYKMENYEEAISDYTECIDYDPNNADAYYWRGKAYYYLEDYSNAISSYNKAIELDPDNIYYLYSRGSSYFLRDKNNDIFYAINDFRKGCELGDNSACKMLKDLMER